MRDYNIDISIDVTYEHIPEGKITFKSEILSDDTISKIFYEVDSAIYKLKTDTTPHIETDEEYAKRVAEIGKPDTPDIDSIAERNYENRRT